MWTSKLKTTAKVVLPAAAGAATLAVGVAAASDDVLHPAQYPWSHEGPFSSFDAKAIRRGHQVYKEICASCHSIKFLHFRDLVGVCYSEDEAKALAAEIEVEDGPNDDGEMYDRPGKLNDTLPSPYENDEQARAINNGALPPDLSLMTKARHDGQNYMFALLTGYKDAPAGVEVNEAAGQYYNPYFPGSKIGMPKQLVDGALEYQDGTPATASQMAKDVTVFLAWAAEPHEDDRKRLGQKFVIFMVIGALLSGYYKRHRWAPLKARKISYFK